MQQNTHRINRTTKMKKSPYTIHSLSIRKAPGFIHGLQNIDELAPNVNIIAGPNASGKSTTARAIQELIWKNEIENLSLHGTVKIDASQWEVDIDAGHIRSERNGINEEITGLPPKEGHQKYLLALHNFVEGNENDLAKEIVKQSIGGYDLEAAKNKLEYSGTINKRKSKEFKNLSEIENKFREVRNQHKALKSEEEKLAQLNKDKDKAIEADKLSQFYLKVKTYLTAKSEYTQLTRELNSFPKELEKINGDEPEQIQNLKTDVNACQAKINTAQKQIKASENQLKSLKLNPEEIDQSKIQELEERIKVLAENHREVNQLKVEIEKAKTVEKNAISAIDENINPDDWQGVNLENVKGLDTLYREAQQVLGEKYWLEAEIIDLEQELNQQKDLSHDENTYNLGINALSAWLKEPVQFEQAGISLSKVMLIASFAVLTSILGFFLGWIGIAASVIFVGIAYFMAKNTSSNSAPQSSTLKIRREDFLKTGLTPPESWETDKIIERLEELFVALSKSKENEELERRLNTCKTKLDKLEDKINSVNTEREKWLTKLQSVPSFPTIDQTDFSSLYFYLVQVQKWQEANVNRKSLESAFEIANKNIQEILDIINTIFVKAYFEKASDLISAESLARELKEESQFFKNENDEIDRNRSIEEEQQKALDTYNQRLQTIYDKIGIQEHQQNELEELIQQKGNYNATKDKHFAAKQNFNKLDHALQEHSLFNEYKDEISTLAIDEAAEKQQFFTEAAKELDEIKEEITQIKTRIEEKKKGHELEDVLIQKDEALEVLYQDYENHLTSVTGSLIIESLKEETQHKNRPEVFNKANKLFNQITLGRYELILNEGNDVQFQAFDTNLKRSFRLTELSTGTRVQLLLAVRLAYIETVESVVRLPILADELLANSDDERAQAIIEALIEISRKGRQVFYFTAQEDEIKKWQTYLSKTNLESKVIRLNSEGNEVISSDQFKTKFSGIQLTHKIPSPSGKTHQEYKDLIAVPSFNVLTQNVGKMSLWYLVEDLDLLHSALEKGIKTWGQLKSYHKNKGRIENLDEATFTQLSNQIIVLKRFQELYKTGRSLPIDRSVLLNSDAVSSSFIDKVSEKLNDLNGDPKALLQALNNGDVSRFRTDNIEELENYLLTHQYIDNNEVLDNEEIMIRLQAVISNSNLSVEDIARFLERVVS